MRSGVVVIGVGNPSRRDDGVGWVVVEAVGRRLGKAVDIVESDAEPSRLLDAWADFDLAVVVDAVRSGAAPGKVHVWADEPEQIRATPSTGSHSLGLADAIALGHALDRLPARLIVVGIEAQETAPGHGLSSAVAGAVDNAVDVIATIVVEHGAPRRCDGIAIRRAGPDDGVARALADVLIDCVEGGASVGFMLPLEHERAEAYWANMLDSASRGERIVLVAEEQDSATVVGTVQVILTAPQNQPHRGEIAKMLVHSRARRRGLAEALMRAAEAAAFEAGKTLLVLDASSADAQRLYQRLGWQRVGAIPGYALWPHGGFVDTTVFYKNLTARSR